MATTSGCAVDSWTSDCRVRLVSLYTLIEGGWAVYWGEALLKTDVVAFARALRSAVTHTRRTTYNETTQVTT